jgi:predicted transcriptional regulator
LDHGFHEVAYLPENDRVRFTISEPARVEVLRRLSELNRQRYKDEVDKGLHGKATSPTSSGSKRARTRSSKAESLGLFDFSVPEKVTENDACKVVLNHLSETDGWLAKDDILTGSGISANQWQSTINQLLSDGLVERQGERRGTRYRAVRKGDLDE